MRAYININQKAFSELAILKSTKIDLIDATIFEYIVKFAVSNKATKQLIDDKLFIWCSYQKIIDDNPLLNINSKKAIELRLIKLIDLGLFEKFTDKKEGNKTYFNVTDLAYKLIIENISISNIRYQPLVTEITKLSNEDYQPLSNEDYYNSKLNNSKLDSNKTINIDTLFIQYKKQNENASEIELNLVMDFIDYRKSIKDKIKTILPAEMYIKELKKLQKLGYKINDCIETMKISEWKTIKTEWIHKPTNNYKASSNIVDTDEWTDGAIRCDPNEYR